MLHFLVDIGDICNDNLGVPHRKCRELFAGARSDCADLLGDFNFLCDILDTFLPLCNIARGAFTYIRRSIDAADVLRVFSCNVKNLWSQRPKHLFISLGMLW